MSTISKGYVKTYSPSLGTGYVKLAESGRSLKFDAQAISPGTPSIRSGDEVFVQASSGGKVELLRRVSGGGGFAKVALPILKRRAATVKLHGDTPARFRKSSFPSTAERLDFTVDL